MDKDDPEISVEQARRHLESDPHCVYLDVRTESEYLAGHVPGALNVPVALLNPLTGKMELNPDFLRVVTGVLDRKTPIVCGCRSGGRSCTAALLLRENGYANAVSMFGGFYGVKDADGQITVEGWSTLGLPVHRGSEEGKGYTELSRKATTQ